ncbi:MAG TPA: tRNA uridine-5-carboxymethylaminomethyl(34) synthesis GTPase MnmE [Gammaproteobacteria bacterium]|nr:tRNA uridine-5-carboxymethylaminomethyl(34) synthesis GTPase MnmE [Gammaproteobacteria bacterium]
MPRAAPDTIAAIATPPGPGGIGVVRLSGPMVPDITRQLLGTLPLPRQAVLRDFRDADGTLIDTGLVLYFAAPASFTGEHVLELHAHGGPVVLDLLLARVLQLGARAARAGEFSERAFLNDKLDLVQAEAIADLIESGTAQAARAAVRSLQGEFSRQVHALTAQLTQLRMYVESAIDFPEEEIDFLSDRGLQQGLQALRTALDELLARARQGRLLRDGLTLVIAGRPNAGKSSLLNALSERESAIVTAIPGTTRDVLREQIQLDGMPLHIIDTAGLHDSTDPVEQAGMQRAREAMAQADRVLLVIDDQAGFTTADAAILAGLPAGVPHTRIHNKADLSGRLPGPFKADGQAAISLSLLSGAGLDDLRVHLRQVAGFAGPGEGEFSARRRHLDALERARAHVLDGVRQLEEQRAGELLAEELRTAQQALGEITGEVSSDDLLGMIFSSFCIGK